MALCHDPLADIAELIRASVERNTEFTTCPICLSGVDPNSFHKEPYVTELPGSAAQTGMVRRLSHTRRPDGNWETTVSLDYE